jgi:hypothetical protein
MAEWTKTQLLGTELEIVSDQDLTTLLAAIHASVRVIRSSLDDGAHTLWVELDVPADDGLGRHHPEVRRLDRVVAERASRGLERGE